MDDYAVFGTAIFFGNYDILGDDEELAGQISSLRGIESRVGKSFARAVSGDEIFYRR